MWLGSPLKLLKGCPFVPLTLLRTLGRAVYPLSLYTKEGKEERRGNLQFNGAILLSSIKLKNLLPLSHLTLITLSLYGFLCTWGICS